jgi:peptidoglycan/xylan/chitin deacetylase (PgdA/CDA1 family)
MSLAPDDVRQLFHRGVVMLSFDVEQIWGYVDLFDEAQFCRRHPGAIEAHTRLLACLAQAGVSATWFVVGGMALHSSRGSRDQRMAGLPYQWTAPIPDGDEETAPLWYRHSFIDILRSMRPRQEIGLHGGLTHFIWTSPLATREIVEWELREGVKALEEVSVTPLSFSFGREREAHYDLLPAHGIFCYRERTVAPSFRLGPNVIGKGARLFDELIRARPRVVWPREALPGLWSIPSSLFLYPIHPSRTRITGLRSRIVRFRRGIEAAIRHRGIFHFCLHPENLTEAPEGFSLFEDMLNLLVSARASGDVEVLTMTEVATRMAHAAEQMAADPIPALGTTL